MKRIREINLKRPGWNASLVEVDFTEIQSNSRNANRMDKRTFQADLELLAVGVAVPFEQQIAEAQGADVGPST